VSLLVKLKFCLSLATRLAFDYVCPPDGVSITELKSCFLLEYCKDHFRPFIDFSQCDIMVDPRTICKRQGTAVEMEGAKIINVFGFIASLQKYSDVAHIQRGLKTFLTSPIRYSSI
jgi:hypothetical protein